MPHLANQNHTKILSFKLKDYDPSIELIHLFALRFLLHSDPDLHHNPITNIPALALYQIFNNNSDDPLSQDLLPLL